MSHVDRRPRVHVREVIEVEYLRGSGNTGDPVRQITEYVDPDGTPLAHRDPTLDADGLREWFVTKGWKIHLPDSAQGVDPFAELARLIG